MATGSAADDPESGKLRKQLLKHLSSVKRLHPLGSPMQKYLALRLLEARPCSSARSFERSVCPSCLCDDPASISVSELSLAGRELRRARAKLKRRFGSASSFSFTKRVWRCGSCGHRRSQRLPAGGSPERAACGSGKAKFGKTLCRLKLLQHHHQRRGAAGVDAFISRLAASPRLSAS